MPSPANGDPRAAREAYLDALPVEEQAKVLRQADKVGPLSDDADWLVAYASQQAALRIEAAEGRIGAAIATFNQSSAKKAQGTSAPAAPRWRWPLQLAVVAIALIVMAAISFSGSVAQRNADAASCPVLASAPAALSHVPLLGTGLAVVSAWPSVPLVVALLLALVIIAVLGYRKSGPPTYQVWP